MLKCGHSPVLLHLEGSASSSTNGSRTPAPIWDFGILGDQDHPRPTGGVFLLLLLSPSHGIFKKSTQRNLSSKGVAAPFHRGTLCGKPPPLQREPQRKGAAETTPINQQSSPSRCKQELQRCRKKTTRWQNRGLLALLPRQKVANDLPEEMDALPIFGLAEERTGERDRQPLFFCQKRPGKLYTNNSNNYFR